MAANRNQRQSGAHEGRRGGTVRRESSQGGDTGAGRDREAGMAGLGANGPDGLYSVGDSNSGYRAHVSRRSREGREGDFGDYGEKMDWRPTGNVRRELLGDTAGGGEPSGPQGEPPTSLDDRYGTRAASSVRAGVHAAPG